MNEADLRAKLRDRIWELVEPSMDGYSRLIDVLIRRLPTWQLQELVQLMEPNEDEG